MAEAILQRVIENLASMIGNEIGLLSGIDREAEKLSSTLSTILAVLEDAETKQLSEKAVKNWLLKLRDAAYAVDDILDECQTEAIVVESQQCRSRIVTKVRTSLYHLSNVLQRRSIGSRMTAIRVKLDEIAEERRKFHLREMPVDGRLKAMDRRQSSSNPSSTEVYGREEDKEKIVEMITNDFRIREKVSVYVIVGMGGIGKTTLAQTVYGDERVKNHFEARIWVSAPEDFEMRRVLKAIVESASGNAVDDLDLDMLGRRLQDLLTGKRYLLVLDDVWSEDQDKWEELRSVLECGSAGSSLIITTRLVKVAVVAGTVRAHTLSALSEDECWLLFRNRAFGEESEERPNIASIGKEIVRKCGGIPLAAKALGSLMRFKVDENEWLAIRDSEIWHLPVGETASILPALRVSFTNLPLPLRACFAYCAVFPKSAVIKKEVLINLWMANGFVSYEGRLEPEDVGKRVCNELCWRSFFQEEVKDRFGNTMSFKMHDLIHDLAQSIMEDECEILNHVIYPKVTGRTRHVTVTSGEMEMMTQTLKRAESL